MQKTTELIFGQKDCLLRIRPLTVEEKKEIIAQLWAFKNDIFFFHEEQDENFALRLTPLGDRTPRDLYHHISFFLKSRNHDLF